MRCEWREVRSKLGIDLPADYKEIIETFPRGRFQGFIEVIRPDTSEAGVEYPSYYLQRLEDMRQWRHDEPGRFPFPIFPESGGLLPWGITHRGDLFFWLTEHPDPDRWPVVLTDFDFSFWETLSRPVCELLSRVVVGDFDGLPYELDLSAHRPFFEPAESSALFVRSTRDDFWASKRISAGRPRSALPELEGLIDTDTSAQETHPVNWADVEAAIGVRLPSDYIGFIERYGPGRFIDIDIAGAGSSSPNSLDILRLISRMREKASTSSTRDRDVPIFPEAGGLIPWGTTDDGRTCCWAVTDGDPNLWGIVVAQSDLNDFEYTWELSFSAFLVKYGKGEYPGVSLEQPDQTPSRIFTPSRP
jgi:hypothetical protein